MGRKKINPNDKQTLVRVYAKKSTIDLVGESEIQKKCSELINRLQSEVLEKCANEGLKY